MPRSRQAKQRKGSKTRRKSKRTRNDKKCYRPEEKSVGKSRGGAATRNNNNKRRKVKRKKKRSAAWTSSRFIKLVVENCACCFTSDANSVRDENDKTCRFCRADCDSKSVQCENLVGRDSEKKTNVQVGTSWECLVTSRGVSVNFQDDKSTFNDNNDDDQSPRKSEKKGIGSRSRRALLIMFDIVFWPYACLPGRHSFANKNNKSFHGLSLLYLS